MEKPNGHEVGRCELLWLRAFRRWPFLLTILLLWIASGRVASEEWAQEIQVAEVRLRVPQGWEVRDLQGAKALLAPVEGPGDMFRENLTVLSEPLSRPLTSAQYAQVVAERSAQALQAFRPGEMRHVRLGGVEAVEFTARGSQGGMSLEWVIWAFVVGQQGYQITFTGEPGKFPNYQAQVHAALASLSTGTRIPDLGPSAGSGWPPAGAVAPPGGSTAPPVGSIAPPAASVAPPAGPVAPPASSGPPPGSSVLNVDGVLQPGLPVQGQVGGPRDNFRTYVVDVPAGARGLTIELQAEADLDLFVRYGRPMENWEQDPEYQSVGPTGREVITLTPESNPPLRPGTYFIDVANLTEGPGGTFTLTARLQPGSASPAAAGPVSSGSPLPVEGVLPARVRKRGGMPPEDLVRFWEVRPPAGARRMYVGIYNATDQLDLVAGPAGQAPRRIEDFPYRSMGPLENERLVVDLTAAPAGPWLVGVVHQADTPVEYEIEVRFDEPLPPLPRYRPRPLPPGGLSPLERAIRASVQISTSAGVGSGSLITPDGWILTNYHVIAECTVASATFGCEGAPLLDASGRPERVAIGLADQERGVAIQYFLAELAHALPEYDLALLRIVSDVNGDPVGQLALPFVPIDVREDAVRAGEDVLVIGYPGIAQTSGRIPLAVTRGIVSGFIEERSRRVLILTDAQINPGNSGGLMIRARDGVLIAVPSDVRYRQEGLQKQNYARPVTLLPPDWLEILEEHGAQIHR